MSEETCSPTGTKARVFLIAGFLGAGKTTLLKQILGWQEDLSDTVVMVNEFGDVGIDGALLKDAGSDVVELTSGCICCTLSSDLLMSLSRIWEQFKPRRIFIESSGVADPSAVVSVLNASALAQCMVLEKVVTVLDADFWEARENFGQLFFNQLKTAHLILLNKIDTIDRELIPQFLEQIHGEIPDSQVLPTIRCHIDSDTLWKPPEPKVAAFQPMSFFKQVSLGDETGSGGDYGHDPAHHPTSVSANHFVTFSFEATRSMDESRFKQFIDDLPFEVFRVKGPVRFEDRTEVLNFVGGKAQWSPWHGERQTRLAFIGWNVNAETMLTKVRRCLA